METLEEIEKSKKILEKINAENGYLSKKYKNVKNNNNIEQKNIDKLNQELKALKLKNDILEKESKQLDENIEELHKRLANENNQ